MPTPADTAMSLAKRFRRKTPFSAYIPVSCMFDASNDTSSDMPLRSVLLFTSQTLPASTNNAP